MGKYLFNLFIYSLFLFSLTCQGADKQVLRVLSWEGYVTQQELQEVNSLLEEQGYNYEVKVIEPYAEGAQQMFNLMRGGHCDISFLTLFFIKMENQKISKLLQPINLESPRLSNYKNLLPSLTHLNMGLNEKGQPLYIPWGGGAYGFYIDRNKVSAADVPTSVKDLWLPKWKNRFSLNQSQQWYNIGLALMSMGHSPFYLHHQVQQHGRQEFKALVDKNGPLQDKLTQLYANAGHFWNASPAFNAELLIVSSWGPEITRENNLGGNWQMINFKEGNMVWLDTINFVKGLKGEKLEAEEIFANYFIGKKVQGRITRELSMVAAAKDTPGNKILGKPDNIFKQNMFVPPYDNTTYDMMKRMAGRASYENRDKK